MCVLNFEMFLSSELLESWMSAQAQALADAQSRASKAEGQVLTLQKVELRTHDFC